MRCSFLSIILRSRRTGLDWHAPARARCTRGTRHEASSVTDTEGFGKLAHHVGANEHPRAVIPSFASLIRSVISLAMTSSLLLEDSISESVVEAEGAPVCRRSTVLPSRRCRHTRGGHSAVNFTVVRLTHCKPPSLGLSSALFSSKSFLGAGLSLPIKGSTTLKNHLVDPECIASASCIAASSVRIAISR
ncbi:hypothetical protein OBBRIDRAFT_618657 [Obba rivulosa]|uniref:Uncharacterized protein n=1 Tax=Obba rivulosa TaxID=1052685 RepID=A0A8E2ASN4_9APHY|nr:hypothetical protein OBBRIDRAFT_618657 [Obba rivulosa]